VKQAPDVADLYFQRGNAYAAAGRHTMAVEDFGRAIQRNPKDPRLFYNRGNDHYHLRQYGEAIEDFTRTVELDASKMDAHHNRAACYFHTGRYDKAWADIEKLKAAGQSPSAELVRQLMLRTGSGTTRADPPADR
jgi:tetratricopeptide (TPR) repeat protein